MSFAANAMPAAVLTTAAGRSVARQRTASLAPQVAVTVERPTGSAGHQVEDRSSREAAAPRMPSTMPATPRTSSPVRVSSALRPSPAPTATPASTPRKAGLSKNANGVPS